MFSLHKRWLIVEILRPLVHRCVLVKAVWWGGCGFTIFMLQTADIAASHPLTRADIGGRGGRGGWEGGGTHCLLGRVRRLMAILSKKRGSKGIQYDKEGKTEHN